MIERSISILNCQIYVYSFDSSNSSALENKRRWIITEYELTNRFAASYNVKIAWMILLLSESSLVGWVMYKVSDTIVPTTEV